MGQTAIVTSTRYGGTEARPVMFGLGGIDVSTIEGGLSPRAWSKDRRHAQAWVLTAGSGEVITENRVIQLAAPCIVWLPVQARATMTLAAGASGALARLSDSALGAAFPFGPSSRSIRDGMRIPILGARVDGNVASRLRQNFESAEAELAHAGAGSAEAVRLHMGLVLLTLWRQVRLEITENRPSPRSIVHGFMQLLELRNREHWTIQRYAAELGVSVDRLSSAISRATGRSPLAHIHGRLIADASVMLSETRLQVSEISDILGFKEAGYFNRFFKRETGEAPGRYRRDAGARRATPDISFAAWP